MLQKATIWERSSFQEPKDACHVCLFIHPVTLPILPNLSQESRMYFCILLYFVYIYPVPTLPILSPGPSVSWTEKKQEPERSLERGRSKYQFVFDVKNSKMFKTINSTAGLSNGMSWRTSDEQNYCTWTLAVGFQVPSHGFDHKSSGWPSPLVIWSTINQGLKSNLMRIVS